MKNIITFELLETIDNYLKGNLSEAEHTAFEKQIELDNELEETVLIQKRLFALHDFETIDIKTNNYSENEVLHYKEQLRSKENQELFTKIREIGKEHRFTKSTSKKNYFKYYIAASIAAILGTILMFNFNSSLESHYKNNLNWEELPSYIDKGQSENYFTKGEISFKNKEYTKAITSFKNITSKNELYPYSLMYIGASYEQLNENEKALETFDKLSKLTSFEERSRGYWYKLLIYMKQNNKEKSLEMKAIIIEDNNNFNYAKANNLDL